MKTFSSSVGSRQDGRMADRARVRPVQGRWFDGGGLVEVEYVLRGPLTVHRCYLSAQVAAIGVPVKSRLVSAVALTRLRFL